MFETEKEVWIEIIETYKGMQYLWDKKDPNYFNKKMRLSANSRLCDVYKKLDKKVTVAAFKRKLKNLRTCYLRELRKVKSSQATAASLDDVYIPSLWYYNLLSFLSENNEPSEELKGETIYLSDPELFEEFSNPKQRLKQETPYNECSSSNSTSPLIQESSTSHSVVNEEAPMAKLVARNKKQRRTIEKKQDQLIEIATKLLTEREEEWDVFGKSVGIQLKSLDPTQGIIAQKLISDILFNAKLGRLCEESTINLKPLSL
ncbi:unnamed protein product [Phyllotreta striolata]|uniref:MADF domain-containing protein n=1 Tax=Phyllotreta striolata TaxID=444603 RepID=A0A9N9XR22_PHYSR|nr:unnamed protein product [Phyllotreta striolata]